MWQAVTRARMHTHTHTGGIVTLNLACKHSNAADHITSSATAEEWTDCHPPPAPDTLLLRVADGLWGFVYPSVCQITIERRPYRHWWVPRDPPTRHWLGAVPRGPQPNCQTKLRRADTVSDPC